MAKKLFFINVLIALCGLASLQAAKKPTFQLCKEEFTLGDNTTVFNQAASMSSVTVPDQSIEIFFRNIKKKKEKLQHFVDVVMGWLAIRPRPKVGFFTFGNENRAALTKADLSTLVEQVREQCGERGHLNNYLDTDVTVAINEVNSPFQMPFSDFITHLGVFLSETNSKTYITTSFLDHVIKQLGFQAIKSRQPDMPLVQRPSQALEQVKALLESLWKKLQQLQTQLETLRVAVAHSK